VKVVCRKVTPDEELTTPAMLEAPAPAPAVAGALADVNTKSSIVTPTESPLTESAMPLAGATVALSARLYVQLERFVVQSSPA
jgi:hypothetical protein